MPLRLTRQQREYQEQILETWGLTSRFTPNRHLINDLAKEIHTLHFGAELAQAEIKHEKTKPLWTIIKERIRKRL